MDYSQDRGSWEWYVVLRCCRKIVLICHLAEQHFKDDIQTVVPLSGIDTRCEIGNERGCMEYRVRRKCPTTITY
jgi:hypothetical protein